MYENKEQSKLRTTGLFFLFHLSSKKMSTSTPLLIQLTYPAQRAHTFEQQFKVIAAVQGGSLTTQERSCMTKLIDDIKLLDMLRDDLTKRCEHYNRIYQIAQMELMADISEPNDATYEQFNAHTRLCISDGQRYRRQLHRVIRKLGSVGHHVQIATPNQHAYANNVFVWRASPQLAIINSSSLSKSNTLPEATISLTYPASFQLELHMTLLMLGQLHFNVATFLLPDLCSFSFQDHRDAEDQERWVKLAARDLVSAHTYWWNLFSRKPHYWRGMSYLAGRLYVCCGEFNQNIIGGLMYMCRALLRLTVYRSMTLVFCNKWQEKKDQEMVEQRQKDLAEGSSSSSVTDGQEKQQEEEGEEKVDMEGIDSEMLMTFEDIYRDSDPESPTSMLGLLFAAGEYARLAIQEFSQTVISLNQLELVRTAYVLKTCIWSVYMLRLSSVIAQYTSLTDDEILSITVKNNSITPRYERSDFMKKTWAECVRVRKLLSFQIHPNIWRHMVYVLSLRAAQLSMYYASHAVLWVNSVSNCGAWAEMVRRTFRDEYFRMGVALVKQRLDEIHSTTHFTFTDKLQTTYLWTVLQASVWHYTLCHYGGSWSGPVDHILFPHHVCRASDRETAVLVQK